MNTIQKIALKCAKDDISDSPELADTMKALTFWTEEAERIRKNRCKSWPDDPRCKELKKGK